jgi:hypothetical protein
MEEELEMGRRRLFVPGVVLALVFCLGFTAEQANAGNREIGGYVAQAEDRFVRNVWNFIKNFATTHLEVSGPL